MGGMGAELTVAKHNTHTCARLRRTENWGRASKNPCQTVAAPLERRKRVKESVGRVGVRLPNGWDGGRTQSCQTQHAHLRPPTKD